MKTIKTIYRILFNLIIIGLVSTFFYFAFFDKDEVIDDSNWIKTYAVLYYIGYGKSSTNRLAYWVDGKRFDYHSSAYSAMIPGEKFEIKYNPDAPKEIKEYTWNPVFLTSEITLECIGEIKRLFYFKKERYAIAFHYKVGNKVFKREQDLPPNYLEQYPSISEGQKYKVIYWAENPERSVMYINKPIKINKTN